MSELMNYAYKELNAIGMINSESEMNNKMSEHILKMVETFSEEGHSGLSSSYAISILEKLLRFRPLTPLTGEDSEWNEIGDKLFQNNRCSTVFKQPDIFDGQAYDIEGKIFVDPDGSCFTNRDSFVPITFPYMPNREYVKREAA